MEAKLGRILMIGRDLNSSSATHGQVLLTLQPVVYPNQILTTTAVRGTFDANSLILIEDESQDILTSLVKRRKTDIEMCYAAKDPKSLRVEWVFRDQHPQLRSASLVHPLPAELEMQVYGRHHLKSLSSQVCQCRAMPVSLFIDGFGIHRNMYRSLKAFYITLASLPYAERRKVSNIFTLTLGPHGASFNSTVAHFKRSA